MERERARRVRSIGKAGIRKAGSNRAGSSRVGSSRAGIENGTTMVEVNG
jgi:hypothetical protein